MDIIVCGRQIAQCRKCLFNRDIFLYLELEIALAISTSNDEKVSRAMVNTLDLSFLGITASTPDLLEQYTLLVLLSLPII